MSEILLFLQKLYVAIRKYFLVMLTNIPYIFEWCNKIGLKNGEKNDTNAAIKKQQLQRDIVAFYTCVIRCDSVDDMYLQK